MNILKLFLFKNTTARQTVAKNTFWLFVSEGIGRVLKMVLVIYAARILGTEGWGLFSYVLSLGSLLMIFSDIGLSGLITREIAQKKEGYKTFIATALFIKSCLLLISTALIVWIAPSISHIPLANHLFPLIALTLCIDAVRDFILSINTAFEKMERDMITKSTMHLILVAVGIGLLNVYPIPESVGVAYVIGSTVGCVIAYFTVRRDLRGLFNRIDTSSIGMVLATTWPFALITLISTIMANTDIYLLSIWRNASDIGLYASAQRIQQFIFIIPVMIATAVFPLLSRLANTDTARFTAIFERIATLIMTLALPIAIGGVLLAQQLVALIFGNAFSGAVPILQLLLITLIASFPLILFSNSIFAYNKQRNIATAYFSGVIANIILNIVLIPRFGAVGSAVATLISTTIVTCFIWIRLRSIIHFNIVPKLWRAAIAVSAMAGCMVLLIHYAIPLFVTILIGIVLYISTLLLLRDPLFIDIRMILRAKTP
jgi:O-antigen/teichoic acid export membrane protein